MALRTLMLSGFYKALFEYFWLSGLNAENRMWYSLYLFKLLWY